MPLPPTWSAIVAPNAGDWDRDGSQWQTSHAAAPPSPANSSRRIDDRGTVRRHHDRMHQQHADGSAGWIMRRREPGPSSQRPRPPYHRSENASRGIHHAAGVRAVFGRGRANRHEVDYLDSRCARLTGFGLALEVQRNASYQGPGDHCFRITGKAADLLRMLDAKPDELPEPAYQVFFVGGRS
jgi:hypothetical protein